MDALHVLIPPSLARPTACFQFRLCLADWGGRRGAEERGMDGGVAVAMPRREWEGGSKRDAGTQFGG